MKLKEIEIRDKYERELRALIKSHDEFTQNMKSEFEIAELKFKSVHNRVKQDYDELLKLNCDRKPRPEDAQLILKQRDQIKHQQQQIEQLKAI